MTSCPEIEKLCDIGSVPIAPPFGRQQVDWVLQEIHAPASEQLLFMLGRKNGFYAFESALHVFPLAFDDRCNDQDLLRWNKPDLWKHAYGGSLVDALCFAEDIFGCQFCLRNDRVCRFDPETGDAEDLCLNLKDWAGLVLADFYTQTGYKIADEWQAAKGPIQPGNRLAPVYPFITNAGTYELSNLYEVNAVTGMLSRADFARQVRDIPEGGKIRIVPTNQKQ